jgi:hypothetical protein
MAPRTRAATAKRAILKKKADGARAMRAFANWAEVRGNTVAAARMILAHRSLFPDRMDVVRVGKTRFYTNAMWDSLHIYDLPGAIRAVQSGADVNGRDPHARLYVEQYRRNLTPLQFAVIEFADYKPGKLVDFLYVLLNRRAKLDVLDADGRTPLHLAVRQRWMIRRIPDMIAGYLYNPARSNASYKLKVLNARDVFGRTALHDAATPRFADLLVKTGANVNVRDKLGMTPLSIAVQNRNLKSVRILLAGGANPTIRDVRGKSPIEYARVGVGPNVDEYDVDFILYEQNRIHNMIDRVLKRNHA